MTKYTNMQQQNNVITITPSSINIFHAVWLTSIGLHKLINCILSGFPHHEIMTEKQQQISWILAAETFTLTTRIIM